VERKKSTRPVKTLQEILLPFTFNPKENIQISVNNSFWSYRKDKQYQLSFPEYEAIAHSSFAHVLEH
jgi:hypothetical protein